MACSSTSLVLRPAGCHPMALRLHPLPIIAQHPRNLISFLLLRTVWSQRLPPKSLVQSQRLTRSGTIRDPHPARILPFSCRSPPRPPNCHLPILHIPSRSLLPCSKPLPGPTLCTGRPRGLGRMEEFDVVVTGVRNIIGYGGCCSFLRPLCVLCSPSGVSFWTGFAMLWLVGFVRSSSCHPFTLLCWHCSGWKSALLYSILIGLSCTAFLRQTYRRSIHCFWEHQTLGGSSPSVPPMPHRCCLVITTQRNQSWENDTGGITSTMDRIQGKHIA